MKLTIYIAVSCIAVYLIGAGFLIGISFKLYCVNPANPTPAEKISIFNWFYPQVILAESFQPVNDFYEWQLLVVE
jgi:hypothetical protein